MSKTHRNRPSEGKIRKIPGMPKIKREFGPDNPKPGPRAVYCIVTGGCGTHLAVSQIAQQVHRIVRALPLLQNRSRQLWVTIRWFAETRLITLVTLACPTATTFSLPSYHALSTVGDGRTSGCTTNSISSRRDSLHRPLSPERKGSNRPWPV